MKLNPRLVIAGGSLLGAVIAVTVLWHNLFTYNDANTILVTQSWGGELSCDVTAGNMKWLGFGRATRYKRRDQFSFSALANQGTPGDESLPITFNDGAAAHISGTVQWAMPTDCGNVIKIHQQYGSQESVDQQLIRTTVQNAINTTGPLMSSTESYAARRNELLGDIEAQITNGPFLTETYTTTVLDPITNQQKLASVVRIKTDDKTNVPLHADVSALTQFGIQTFGLSLQGINYPDSVKDQIAKQQAAVASVQTALAEAKQAEQRAITVAKQGEANAAEAKWKQEVIKTQEVTKAEQDAQVQKINADRDSNVAKINADREATVAKIGAEKDLQVAELHVKTAENDKQAAILKGEGEAKARQLVMAADGALDKKLATWLDAQKSWANAMGQYKGNLVPQVVTGGANGAGTVSAGSGAQDLINLMGIKAAKDLALDLSMGTPAPAAAAPAAH